MAGVIARLRAAGDPHPARLRQPDAAQGTGRDLRARALQARADRRQRRPQGRRRRLPREADGQVQGTVRAVDGQAAAGRLRQDGRRHARGLAVARSCGLGGRSSPSRSRRSGPKSPGFACVASRARVSETPEIVVLAVKPQIMDARAARPQALRRRGRRVPVDRRRQDAALFRRAISAPTAKVVRSMPNTPAAVRQGISVATRGAGRVGGREEALPRAARGGRPGRCGSRTRR